MATALEARAMNFATETKLAEPIQKWLIAEGIVTVEDIAQICHDEASCDANFINEAFKAGVKVPPISGRWRVYTS